ncbi:MAG: hypothetical protein AAGA58_11705 [Verrucomicrobiota bacterium]
MESWYLKKHDDGSVYGPATMDQLRDWALAAKVSPMDKVSNDKRRTWKRAPMVSELHMDWLVEVSSEFTYGPTTFGTVQEFISSGEIGDDTVVINCRDGKRHRVRDLPVALNSPRRPSADEVIEQIQRDATNEVRSIGETDNDKILRLERVILQLRLALNEEETRYRKLRQLYVEATGREP